METIERYNELMRKTFHKQHVENPISTYDLDDYALHTIDVARANNYLTHNRYGRDPRVFIWSDTRNVGINQADQGSDLFNIFFSSMGEGDVLLSDTDGPFELDAKKAVAKDKLISKLQGFFNNRDIRVMFNDNAELMDESYLINTKQVALADEGKFREGNSDYAEVTKDYLENLELRSLSMSNNNLSGIIPCYRGTNKGVRVDKNARIHQIIGLAYLNLGCVTSALEKSGVSYVSFIPKFNAFFEEK